MKSIVFLAGMAVLLVGGFGLVDQDAFALSCMEDGTGNCDQFLYRGPPLKQMESGAGLGDVFCSNTLLVIKQSIGAPACVFGPTLEKLIERGWGVTLDDHIKNGQNVEIVLEHPHCFGTCPVYTVTIDNSGTLVFEGTEYLDTIGVETGSVSSEDIANLTSYIDKIDYFSLEDAKTPSRTDVTFIYTTVTIGDKTHTVRNYVGEFGIAEVTKLESMINGLANSEGKIYANTSIPNTEIILEQGPCFGACPVYTITISDDGTLVFEGTEFSDTIGIETEQISIGDLLALIKYVEEIDYFSLESPDDKGITDVPRTTTTVSIGDKTNTITNIETKFGGNSEVAELESMINNLAGTQNRIDGTSTEMNAISAKRLLLSVPDATTENDLLCQTSWNIHTVGKQNPDHIEQSVQSTLAQFGFTYFLADREITAAENPTGYAVSISGLWDPETVQYDEIVKDLQRFGSEVNGEPASCQ